MTSSRSKSLPDIGFMTVVESAEHGFFGGYLVLNYTGRPLEFHCTAPVRPNRAQEILYGPTLKPYLYGEQIGQTLWSQTKNVPRIVCTDMAEILHVRQFIACPVVLLGARGDLPLDTSAATDTSRLDTAHAGTAPPHTDQLRSFRAGDYALAVPEAYPDDEPFVIQQCKLLGASFDLHEPVDRIRHAIQEAQLQ